MRPHYSDLIHQQLSSISFNTYGTCRAIRKKQDDDDDNDGGGNKQFFAFRLCVFQFELHTGDGVLVATVGLLPGGVAAVRDRHGLRLLHRTPEQRVPIDSDGTGRSCFGS